MRDFYHKSQYFILLFSFGIVCLQNPSLAQQPEHKLKTLKGMVVSADNNDFLVGVHIYAKIAHAGRVSDQQGIFDLMVDEYDTLIITFVGYERQVVPLVYFRENKIDMVIRMDPETIVLPGITIMGDQNIDYLKRPERTAIRIPGLQAPAKKPDVDVPVGSLSYGIISRWSKEAKEKRKLMDVYAADQREKIYIKTVSSDSVMTIFMKLYDLNESEYNDFVIFFNTYKPYMDRQDPKDIVRVMHQVFLKYKPGRE